ncbi:hypothetical protein [Novipirellula rosea]|uniref:Uncharacterized protein n=1 Tax=Novipirellula rosea TaxID=1031540 RepID=A0ABP8NKS9_9BACT
MSPDVSDAGKNNHADVGGIQSHPVTWGRHPATWGRCPILHAGKRVETGQFVKVPPVSEASTSPAAEVGHHESAESFNSELTNADNHT